MTSLRSGVKMVLMKKQINNKYIDELFGIKILDSIKKYTKKKNTKPSIYNFYFFHHKGALILLLFYWEM